MKDLWFEFCIVTIAVSLLAGLCVGSAYLLSNLARSTVTIEVPSNVNITVEVQQ